MTIKYLMYMGGIQKKVGTTSLTNISLYAHPVFCTILYLKTNKMFSKIITFKSHFYCFIYLTICVKFVKAKIYIHYISKILLDSNTICYMIES